MGIHGPTDVSSFFVYKGRYGRKYRYLLLK
nr:MAG TPA: hypothetical protein [Caudoviricetes sp.]